MDVHQFIDVVDSCSPTFIGTNTGAAVDKQVRRVAGGKFLFTAVHWQKKNLVQRYMTKTPLSTSNMLGIEPDSIFLDSL